MYPHHLLKEGEKTNIHWANMSGISHSVSFISLLPCKKDNIMSILEIIQLRFQVTFQTSHRLQSDKVKKEKHIFPLASICLWLIKTQVTVNIFVEKKGRKQEWKNFDLVYVSRGRKV
jgi:hypothetical protein